MAPTSTDSQAIDTTLRALADEQRRLVIRYLRETPDGIASYDELQSHLTRQGSAELTPREVAIRLHHALLPTLADADILEYDPLSETVRYQPNPLVESVLETLENIDGSLSNE